MSTTNQAADTFHLEPAAPADETPRQDAAPVTGDEAAEPRMVPVTEAIRYRRRAQAAEQQLTQVQQRIEAMQSELAQATQTIAQLERRQKIDALLTEAKTIDIEAARLLTEMAVQMMDEPDLRAAVDDLRRQKPYLFRRGNPAATSMPAHLAGDARPVDQAAQRAIDTGDRSDLLSYLRLRRGK